MSKVATKKPRAKRTRVGRGKPPPLSREAVAYHEAGHAVAMIALRGGLTYVAIGDGDNPEGQALPPLIGERVSMDRILLARRLRRLPPADRRRKELVREALAHLWIILAGLVAERRFIGAKHSGIYSAADGRAIELLGPVVWPPVGRTTEPFDPAKFWSCWRRVDRFIARHWVHVSAIASRLVREGVVRGDLGRGTSDLPALLAPLSPIQAPKLMMK